MLIVSGESSTAVRRGQLKSVGRAWRMNGQKIWPIISFKPTKLLEQYRYVVDGWGAARVRYANETAASYFEQAADLAATLDKEDYEIQWRITSGLGEVHHFVGQYEKAAALLESGISDLVNGRLTPALSRPDYTGSSVRPRRSRASWRRRYATIGLL